MEDILIKKEGYIILEEHFKNDYVSVEELLGLIEELTYEIEDLKDKIETLENQEEDIDYGVYDHDFI